MFIKKVDTKYIISIVNSGLGIENHKKYKEYTSLFKIKKEVLNDNIEKFISICNSLNYFWKKRGGYGYSRSSGFNDSELPKDNKELDQLGIFKESFNSITLIEWPELIKKNITNRLELHLSYSKNDKERKLSIIGFGKWKNIIKNEF